MTSDKGNEVAGAVWNGEVLSWAEWADRIKRALADGEQGCFLAAAAGQVIFAGRHGAGGFCWCQPTPVPHREHTDYEHHGQMD